jgi:excisionase family DNA binding protein
MVVSDERARLLQDLDRTVPVDGAEDGPDGPAEDGSDGTAPVDALAGRLLRTHEVAVLFQVSERAVTDWAARGRLPSVRTPGGHRRYPAHAVVALLRDVGLR